MKSFISKIAIMALLLLAGKSYGQVWNTVGSGIPVTLQMFYANMASTEANGNIYVVYTKWNPSNSTNTTNVMKWNGLAWSTYPTLPSTTFWAKDISVIGSHIYVVGTAYTGTNNSPIYDFDGSSWSAKAPAGYSGNALTSEVVNGDIVVGGNFTSSGPNYIMRYDGTSFYSYPALSGSNNTVIDIHQYNGDLYIADNRGGGSSSNPDGLLKLNTSTSTWDQPAHFLQGTTTTFNEFKIFDYQNHLYVGGEDYDYESNILEVSNDSLHKIGNITHNITDFQSYNGLFYLVGDTAKYAGPSNRITRFDGMTLTPVAGPTAIAGADTLGGELYLFSITNNTLNGNIYNHAFRTHANFSLLSGQVYLDGNGDCFKNTGEIGLKNAMISYGGNNVVTTDANGQYSLAIAPGTYSLDTAYITNAINKNISLSCSLPSSITIGSNQSITQDIGFSNPITVDMQTFITSYTAWTAIYGFTQNYGVDVNNTGNSTMASATVDVTVPSTVTVLSTNPSPASVSGNVYTFNMLNVQPLESRKINFSVEIDTNSNALGDTLTWMSTLGTVSGDADLSDNADTLEQIVVGSYDPNNKQASAYQIAPGTNKIDYQINFQNTGTDTAYQVIVVDTLDLSLPVTNIVINSASHSYSLSVNNNILVWTFNNIMLPDSGADYSGSQGYVRFSAGITPSLAVGDTIDNDAHIFFDYQPSIHTNHAKTAVVQSVVSLKENQLALSLIDVYPNPAKDKIHILNKDHHTVNLSLIDATGKVIDEFKCRPDIEMSYSIAHLSPGLYLLKTNKTTYRLLISN